MIAPITSWEISKASCAIDTLKCQMTRIMESEKEKKKGGWGEEEIRSLVQQIKEPGAFLTQI